jgi:hypothetical protein
MMTNKDCEEFNKLIEKMKDSNNRGDSYADIPNYIKYNIESTEGGHIIKIITETGIHTYNCKWKDHRRTGHFTKKEA